MLGMGISATGALFCWLEYWAPYMFIGSYIWYRIRAGSYYHIQVSVLICVVQVLEDAWNQGGLPGLISAAQDVGSCIFNSTVTPLLASGYKAVIIGTVAAMQYCPEAVQVRAPL